MKEGRLVDGCITGIYQEGWLQYLAKSVNELNGRDQRDVGMATAKDFRFGENKFLEEGRLAAGIGIIVNVIILCLPGTDGDGDR